jgi:hypothetical protein
VERREPQKNAGRALLSHVLLLSHVPAYRACLALTCARLQQQSTSLQQKCISRDGQWGQVRLMSHTNAELTSEFFILMLSQPADCSCQC